jgi:hypothetical protein
VRVDVERPREVEIADARLGAAAAAPDRFAERGGSGDAGSQRRVEEPRRVRVQIAARIGERIVARDGDARRFQVSP